MNKVKLKKIFFYIAGLVIILFTSYLNVQNKVISDENMSLKKDITSLKQDYLNKTDIEGRYIWDVTGIDNEKTWREYIDKKIKKPFMFFWLDSIECSTCLNNHIESTKELINKNTPVVFFSPLHSGLLKKAFKRCIESPNNKVDETSIMSKFNLVNCLVDTNGKIISCDIANTNRWINENFYKKLNKLLNNSK